MLNSHDKAMDYLHELGIGGSEAPDEAPDWENYFISKNLEQLIESGEDHMEKTFDLLGQDGSQFKATFTLTRILSHRTGESSK
jgi:hypothetical protein